MATQTDRAEFLKRVTEALGVGLPDGVEAACNLVKAEGESLGKTQRWRGACTGLLVSYDEAADADDVEGAQRFAVLRGLVDLTDANA
ncbi:hypothetical protein [Streptomyces flavidovirens]|uniref:hypothetical protein n=1 Tax=Streptomyces flavidovirens TaxID=67298 RepID=UPI0036B1DAE9